MEVRAMDRMLVARLPSLVPLSSSETVIKRPFDVITESPIIVHSVYRP